MTQPKHKPRRLGKAWTRRDVADLLQDVSTEQMVDYVEQRYREGEKSEEVAEFLREMGRRPDDT